MTEIIEELYRVIEDRKRNPKQDSYTSSLMENDGEDKIIEKIGEETTEVALASKNGDDEELIHESADVIYHLFVLLAYHDIELEEFLGELEKRRK